MNFNAFIYLFFILLKFSYSTLSEQCTKSSTFWNSLKYPYLNVLQPIKSQTTPIKCPSLSTSTCCSDDMSKEMSSISEIKLKGLPEEKIEWLLTMFSNDSFVLMNMFLNDLDNTKNDLNTLFAATYGYNYKLHRDFFFTWFDKLKSYMEGKLHNISQLLDNFFNEMATRIVKILIPPESGAEVTKCHTQSLIEAKPYQDTDVNLKSNIIRSYPPARLLVNAIAVGRDVFKQLMKKINPSAECIGKYNSAFHCMLCNGLTIKSCQASCKTIMENCFGSLKSSDLKKLDKNFNKYLKAIVSLAARSDNSFNFPIVNHKMNVQISTAIMNVQNTYPNVKDKIKSKCQKSGGMPTSRKKRQASQEFYNWQVNNNKNPEKPWWEKNLETNMNPNSQKKNTLVSQSNKPNDFLSPIARNIKLKYKNLERYFSKIVPEFCAANSDDQNSPQCWNGTAAIKSVPTVEKNGKKKVDKVNDVIIKTALNQLHEMTVKMNDFLTGKNPDPKTLAVDEFKLYKSKPDNNPDTKLRKSSNSPIIEGSGDSEKLPINIPILPPNKPDPKPDEQPPINPSPILLENPDKPDKPNQPNKPNNKFPTWSEGSGDTESPKSENEDNIPIKPLPRIPPVKVTTTSKSVKVSTSSSEKVVTKSTPKPNELPDDEDISPIPEEMPKVKQVITTTSAAPIIPLEGSGSDLDNTLPKQKLPLLIKPSTTTKTPSLPDKPIEGSGNELEPKPDEKPRPVLPMLPNSSGGTTKSPPKSPVLNPDEEMPPVEGSGGSSSSSTSSSEIVMPSKPQPITDSTLSPTKPLPPDQYPGKIPSEVWIPGINGVKNSDKDNQKTTPGSQASRNHRSTTATITTLSLLLIYYLQ